MLIAPSQVLAWLDGHPVTGAALLAGAGAIAVGVVKWFKDRQLKAEANPYLNPTFYSRGGKYFVIVVHEYFPDDHPSGYRQVQHSRPDQWRQLIDIRTDWFGFRHRIVPKNPLALLVVVIRPTALSREKLVRFNR